LTLTRSAMGAFANVKGLAFYRDNDDDPYITLKEDEDETEREELALLPTDSMFIAARTTSDLSSLDFHVYDDPNENLYVHHDLMLPSFPLCVEWLDFPSGSSSSATGSYVAVGTFDPTIEIWDADLVDGLYPQTILGPSPSLEKPQPKPLGTGKKKRKQLVQPAANAEHHVQPVLTLSWTPHHRHLLLSGSADATIKLWDLTRESPMGAVRSWDRIHGGEKVQAVEWNKSSAAGLDKAVLSAGWDRRVRVWDSRAAEEGIAVAVGSDVECVRWDPWEPTSFYVSQVPHPVNWATCHRVESCSYGRFHLRTVSLSRTTRAPSLPPLPTAYLPPNQSTRCPRTTAPPRHSTSIRTSAAASLPAGWTSSSRSGT
jgi:periodic tryptophan protein 1